MEDLNQDSWPFIFLPYRAVWGEVDLTPQSLPVWVIFPCCASMGNEVLKTDSLIQRAVRVFWSGSHFPSLSRLIPTWSILMSSVSSHCAEMKHWCLWTSVDNIDNFGNWKQNTQNISVCSLEQWVLDWMCFCFSHWTKEQYLVKRIVGVPAGP